MLEDKILEKIEKEGLSPRPYWFFLSGDILRMAISAIVFAVAITSTGVSLYFLKNANWESFILAPFYIFTMLAIASVFVFVRLIRRFAGLYKLGFILMLAPIFLADASFGYYSLNSGFAEKIESNLEKVSVYEKMIPKKIEKKIIESRNIEAEKKNMRREENRIKKSGKENPSKDMDKDLDKKNDKNKESGKILNENGNQGHTQENNPDKNEQKVLGVENSRKNENAQEKTGGKKLEVK